LAAFLFLFYPLFNEHGTQEGKFSVDEAAGGGIGDSE
jgi:hypothetical protein